MTNDRTSEPAEPGPVGGPSRRVEPHLLELLVCPVTRSTLVYDATRQELVSKQARLAYPIQGGVPKMSIESARQLDDP